MLLLQVPSLPDPSDDPPEGAGSSEIAHQVQAIARATVHTLPPWPGKLLSLVCVDSSFISTNQRTRSTEQSLMLAWISYFIVMPNFVVFIFIKVE